MDVREKLIELLCNLPTPEFVIGTRRAGKKLITAGFIADHLISNGVTVQENTAADVAPVRHGRWIDKGEYAVCTECGGRSGTQYEGVEPIPLMTQFCPNCGAKMEIDYYE